MLTDPLSSSVMPGLVPGIHDFDATAVRSEVVDPHMSSGQTVSDARAIYGRMYQVPFSDQIRNEARLATMCVGNITTADQVNTIIAAGRADLVALGRPHLANPYFTLHAAAQYGVTLLPCPPQYAPGKQQLFRVEEQARREIEELRRKARPRVQVAPLARAAE